jgi:hypothetical protein
MRAEGVAARSGCWVGSRGACLHCLVELHTNKHMRNVTAGGLLLLLKAHTLVAAVTFCQGQLVTSVLGDILSRTDPLLLPESLTAVLQRPGCLSQSAPVLLIGTRWVAAPVIPCVTQQRRCIIGTKMGGMVHRPAWHALHCALPGCITG